MDVEPLRRFIRARVRHADDADDLLQDVLARLHEKPPDGDVAAWIWTVARHAIIDYYRRRRPAAPLPAGLAADSPAPRVSRKIASWLRPMMERLPAADREAIVAADLDGLPQRELASRLGLSLTGAKSRVQRARARLRTILLECCAVEFDRRGHASGYTPRRRGCCAD
jgi:RNA polymerase sigma-70 factor (ECF subfamily)